jgi:hypothetical protein
VLHLFANTPPPPPASLHRTEAEAEGEPVAVGAPTGGSRFSRFTRFVSSSW